MSGDAAFLGPVLTLPIGDVTMSFRQFGSGPDLVLLPAQGGMNLWPSSLLASLAQHHRVTMVENRSVGYTTGAGTPFTYEDLADDAAGLIGALGLDRPAVFGWSTGGEVGLVLAARHPDAISSLAITGATAGGPEMTRPAPEIVECLAADVGSCDLLGMMFTDTPAGSAALGRWVTEISAVPTPDAPAGTNAAYTAAAEAYWAAGVDENAITVPVLVMGGEDDPIAPAANARLIGDRIGDNADVVLQPGGLHAWFLEDPRFVDTLDAFLLPSAPTTTEPATGQSVTFTSRGEQVQPLAFEEQQAVGSVIHSQVTGDLTGTLTTTQVAVDGEPMALAWFEGTAGSCGAGGAVIRLGVRPDGTTGWEVVGGLGRGDLSRMTGSGTETPSRFEGTLDCAGAGRRHGVATTLLEPTPDSGEAAGVPAHLLSRHNEFDVDPHPDQTMAPRMLVWESWFDDLGTMYQLFAWRQTPQGDLMVDCAPELCNTSMAWWFLPDVCGQPGVTRAIIDDVEIPSYQGAWDIPASLNDGSHGGGHFHDGDWTDGRAVCT